MSRAIYTVRTTGGDPFWMAEKRKPDGVIVERKQFPGTEFGDGDLDLERGDLAQQVHVTGTEIVLLLLTSQTFGTINLFSTDFAGSSGAYLDLSSYFSIHFSVDVVTQRDGALWVRGKVSSQSGSDFRVVVISPDTLTVQRTFVFPPTEQPVALSQDQKACITATPTQTFLQSIIVRGTNSTGSLLWSNEVVATQQPPDGTPFSEADYKLYSFVGCLGNDKGLFLTTVDGGGWLSTSSSMAVIELSTGNIVKAPFVSDTQSAVDWQSPFGSSYDSKFLISYDVAYDESSNRVMFHLRKEDVGGTVQSSYDFIVGEAHDNDVQVQNISFAGTSSSVMTGIPAQITGDGEVIGHFRDEGQSPDYVDVYIWRHDVRSNDFMEQLILQGNAAPIFTNDELAITVDGLAGVGDVDELDDTYAFFWTKFRNTIEQMPTN